MKKKLQCVLLVDDDDATNFINHRLLKKAELAEKIQITFNGKEALEYLQRSITSANDGYNYPELILLDINMPLMDGWQFLEAYDKIVSEHKDKAGMIIMLTTSLDPRDQARARASKYIADFMEKPLTLQAIDTIGKKLFQDRSEN